MEAVMTLIIGNTLAFLGCILMVLTGVIKRKDRVLYLQCVQFALMAGGNLVLGAIAGVVANSVSIIRNLIFAKTDGTKSLKILFIVVQTALTLLTGDASVLQWLPVLATVALTWALDTKNIILFKAVNIFGLIMWVIYDWNYRNYVGFSFDILSVLSNFTGIFMIRKDADSGT